MRKADLNASLRTMCATKLRHYGCLVRRMNRGSYGDWPDLMVLTPEGVTYFIDFGVDCRLILNNLRAANFKVFFCDNVADALATIRQARKSS